MNVGWVEPQAKPNVLRSESKPLSSSRTRGSRVLNLTHVAWVEVFITASAERFVSRLTRDSLFPVAEKVSKKACPYLGSPLRSDFPHSAAAPGAVTTGRPWPDVPFAAPGRSTPSTSTPLGLR